ncbi:MAG: outer membrane protein assembly factor BamE [Gammaproteobacteria bacterium]|nr:outer membrane protein assembly factor BamE [Gammaproteobacteria bacterium]
MAIVAILAGCGKIGIPKVDMPWVYKIDIQQGNVVTQDMLDKLEPGMEKRKVRFILGTPLIVSAFDQNRWDYVYNFQPGGGEREQRRISLFFKDDKLEHIEGNIVSHKFTGDNLPKNLELRQERRLPNRR